MSLNEFGKPREEWEIREDARTLARAEEIKADKDRMREATRMAKQLADEDIKRVSGMLKVAGRKAPRGNSDRGAVDNNIPTGRRGYRNPATIGRL